MLARVCLSLTLGLWVSLAQASSTQVEVVFFRIGHNESNNQITETHSCPQPTLNWAIPRLANSLDYQPVQYLCWQQELLPQSQTNSQKIKLPQLEGNIKIFSGRLIHVHLDLQLAKPWSGAIDAYRIQQEQSLELGKLYYLDSPGLGILIQLSNQSQSELSSSISSVIREVRPLNLGSSMTFD